MKTHEQSSSSHHFTESQSTQLMSSSPFADLKERKLDPKHDEHKPRFEDKEEDKKNTFLFPFQRRARSHSPPSEEQIHNKIAEAIHNNVKPEKERSWSKSLEYKKNQSPVVANTSFMIGGADFQKTKRLGDRTKRYKTKGGTHATLNSLANKGSKMLKGQEVEDWLYNNNATFGNNEKDYDELLDDQDIQEKVASNLGRNKPIKKEKKSQNVKNGELGQWMYQTVDSFNENSSQTRNNNEGNENQHPNTNNQSKLDDRLLEEFMKQSNIVQDDKFSITQKDNEALISMNRSHTNNFVICDYDDLDSYVEK